MLTVVEAASMTMPGRLSSALGRISERVPEASWLVLVVSVPLYLNPWSATNFEPDKTLLVLFLVALAGSAVAVSLALTALVRRGATKPRHPGHRERSLLRHPFVLVALAWLGVRALSTALSVDPSVSWFGSYFRRQGTLVVLAYVALFLVVARHGGPRATQRRLHAAILLGGGVLALYGVLQQLGLDPLLLTRPLGKRSPTTLGNPIFAGGLLLFPLFLAGARRAAARRGTRHRAAATALFVLLFAGLLTTASRGPALGAMAGAVAVLWAWWLRPGNRVLPPLRGLLVGGALLAAALFMGVVSRPVPYLGRMVAGIVDLHSGTTRFRLEAWSAVSDLVVSTARTSAAQGWSGTRHVVLGYGPETLGRVVRPFQAVRFRGTPFASQQVDRAHNQLLDELVATGTLGLAGYVLLWQVCLFVLTRNAGIARQEPRRAAVRYAWWQAGSVGATVVVTVVATGTLQLLGLAITLGVLGGWAGFLLETRVRGVRTGGPALDFLGLALMGAFVAHLVEIQFAFETTTSQLVFWVLAGSAVAREREGERPCLATGEAESESVGVREPTAARAWLGALAGVAAIVLVFDFLGTPQPSGTVVGLVSDAICGAGPGWMHSLGPVLLAPWAVAWLLAVAGHHPVRPPVAIGLALAIVPLTYGMMLVRAGALRATSAGRYVAALTDTWLLALVALVALALLLALELGAAEAGSVPVRRRDGIARTAVGLAWLLALAAAAWIVPTTLGRPLRCGRADIWAAFADADLRNRHYGTAHYLALAAAATCPERPAYSERVERTARALAMSPR